MNPKNINGCRQKGAFIRGMQDARDRVLEGNCPWEGLLMFKYWRAGYLFYKKHQEIYCEGSFKEMLVDWYTTDKI